MAPMIKIHQREVQWKQGGVIDRMLYASSRPAGAHAPQDSSKGGAVETGCSDLYAAMY